MEPGATSTLRPSEAMTPSSRTLAPATAEQITELVGIQKKIEALTAS
jgi:hypothetical protein